MELETTAFLFSFAVIVVSGGGGGDVNDAVDDVDLSLKTTCY